MEAGPEAASLLFAPEGLAAPAARQALRASGAGAAALAASPSYDAKSDPGVDRRRLWRGLQPRMTAQKRDNGEPYITHPLAVATILAGYRLDSASIITALLHDVIEDTRSRWPRCRSDSARKSPGWSMASPS